MWATAARCKTPCRWRWPDHGVCQRRQDAHRRAAGIDVARIERASGRSAESGPGVPLGQERRSRSFQVHRIVKFSRSPGRSASGSVGATRLGDGSRRSQSQRNHHTIRSSCRTCRQDRDIHNPNCLLGCANPVELGLVASLARPGGNLTGCSLMAIELTPKRLDLLSELVPQSSRRSITAVSAFPC